MEVVCESPPTRSSSGVRLWIVNPVANISVVLKNFFDEPMVPRLQQPFRSRGIAFEDITCNGRLTALNEKTLSDALEEKRNGALIVGATLVRPKAITAALASAYRILTKSSICSSKWQSPFGIKLAARTPSRLWAQSAYLSLLLRRLLESSLLTSALHH